MRFEYIYPIISTSIWGISITGAKIIGNSGFAPIEITFGRFALASIIFLPTLMILSRKRDDIIPDQQSTLLYLFALSLTGVAVNNSIFYFGLARTDASIASLIVSLNPLMTMIFAVILLGEGFSFRKGISVVLGIIGVSLIIGFSGNGGQLEGNIFILIAITIWGSSFSFSRKAIDSGLSSLAVTGWSEIMGSLILFPIILQQGTLTKYSSISSGTVVFWFVFMGIFSSFFAYIIHYKSISILGAGTVAPSTNIIPFSGAITAFFVLNEKIEGSPFIGVILVIIGVILVQTEKQDKMLTE